MPIRPGFFVRQLRSCVLALVPLLPLVGQAQPVTPNTVNVTVGQLLAGMTEPSGANSDAIDMYLLGVFDATEVVDWCDYRLLKVDTLRDAVYGELRGAQGTALAQRAAPAVRAALARRFPCRR